MPRVQLLLLLLLPALVVPRGVLLDWCLCVDEAAGCCTSCCDVEDPTDVMDCESCHSIEVEDFDEVLTGAAPKLPPFDALAAAPAPQSLRLADARTNRCATLRAPPRVTPPGLRPGVAPLRL